MELQLTLDSINESELRKQLTSGLSLAINSRIAAAIPGIRTSLAVAIDIAIVASPEFASLIGGKLQAELGVVEPLAVLRGIINGLISGMVISQQPAVATADTIVAGLSVEISRSDMSEVLGIVGSSFTSEGGYKIDWLNWLLTQGDAIIIADYQFVAGASTASRTGLGVMKTNGIWRVPSEFAGTASDNWITRALHAIEGEVLSIIQLEIVKVF